jgi:hypothetical protein
MKWLRSLLVPYVVAFTLAFIGMPCVSFGLVVASLSMADLQPDECKVMLDRGLAVGIAWLVLTLALAGWLSLRARKKPNPEP